MEVESPEIAEMIAEIGRIANAIEAGVEISVESDRLRLAARGLAGLAEFLQDRILPEVVAGKNASGERQVRWVIETSMCFMTKLTTHAEINGAEGPLVLALPTPLVNS